MITLYKKGLEVYLDNENGQKLKVNLQKNKNGGLGAPVVWIGDLTNGGKKWYSLSKLSEGINEITDLEKSTRTSNGVGHTKLEEYLTREEFEEYNTIKNRIEELKELANKRRDDETLVDRYMSGKVDVNSLTDEQMDFIRSKMLEIVDRLKRK